jgi:hypothetical protein
MILISQRPYPERKVREIALTAVRADFKHATTLEDVSDRAKVLVDSLAHFSSGPNERPITSVMLTLNDLHVLLVEGSPPSLVKVCAKLRKLERSDLGLVAAKRAMQDVGITTDIRTSALNTGAAAALDVDRLRDAAEMLGEAWKLEHTAYVANTQFRCSLMQGLDEEALQWATEAVALDPSNRASWSSLAAASRVAGDESTFQRAIEELESLPPPDDGESRRWSIFAAGKVLAEAGRYLDAESVVVVLRGMDEDGLAARLEDLLTRLRRKK